MGRDFPKNHSVFTWIITSILIFVLGVTTGILVIVWLERKIKPIVKRRHYSGNLGGDSFLFNIGPAVVVVPVFFNYLVIPLGHRIILADLDIGVFYWIAVSSIAPLGLLMAGYGSNNKYSFLGCLRVAAQSISYEIPLALINI
ncbi:hypothetical protein O6H91_09G061200 [Diphasiastrum complanatum]|uniref:Uncharacterized protein n=1 Tax=Diphasiastrum complanatum TaxID=34168 RepID=A0ACC2CPP1_DIPCM|nr:hypothetical protein O6H91_09G061200 [Diphasiastrum complanatum]